jgi:hypothetical protein
VKTLADRIARDGPVNELDAVGWAIRLAKRLEALHTLGVAHGSVSPACIVSSAVERTSKGYLADVQFTTGMPAFQSPERIVGGDLSPADDTWAVAATLYTALTGKAPFEGANEGEIRQKIIAAAPAPLAVYDVGDDDLQHIIDLAFAREIRQRTTTVNALRHALEEWHPDPTVGALYPLDDEDTSMDLDDIGEVKTMARRVPVFTDAVDDDDARTLARAPLVSEGSEQGASAGARGKMPGAPPLAVSPMGVVVIDDDEDDENDDEVRTVMRILVKDESRYEARPAAGRGPAMGGWQPSPGGPLPPRPGTAGPRMPDDFGMIATLPLSKGNVFSQPDKGAPFRAPVAYPGSGPGGGLGAYSPGGGASGALRGPVGAGFGSPLQAPGVGLPYGSAGAGPAPLGAPSEAALRPRFRLNRGILLAALIALIVAALTFALLRFGTTGRLG